MKWFLKVRQVLKTFYEQYARYCDILFRFVFSLLVYLTVMYNTGYNAAVTNPFIAAGLAVISAFLPVPAIAIFTSVLLFLEFMSVAIEVAVITAVFLLVMLLMYFVFKAGDSWILCFVLLLLLWNFSPAILPLALLIKPVEVIVIVFGVILYGIMMVVKRDVSALSSLTGNLSSGGRVNLLLTDLFTNERFYLILVSLVAAALLISVIRRSKINFAAMIAMVVGDVLFLILYLFGMGLWTRFFR